MAWGVVPEGFNRKGQPEVKMDLDNGLVAKFGPATNVGTSSVFGRIVGIFASAIAALWQTAEDVYNAFSPDTASGIALDNCVALTGIARKGATASQAWGILRMAPAGLVPWGSRVAVKDTVPPAEFALDLNVATAPAATCFGGWVTIDAVAVGDTYTVTVNGTPHNYTALLGDDELAILNALLALIEAGAVKDLVRCEVLDAEPSLEVLAEPDGADVPATLSIAVSVAGGGGGAISLPQTGAVGYLTASLTGPQEAPARTLTDILDAGDWLSVVNPAPAAPGQDIETDAELRLRRARSIHIANGGTVDAIRTALLSLADVEEATVLENVTDLTDALGVPPHAIYAIVDCPVDPDVTDAVGAALWESKPAGIATHGTVAVTVEDSQGFDHTLYFSRPTAVRVYVKVEYQKYDEETFPATGEQGIKEAVVDYATVYEIGIDVLPHRFYGPIFAAVPGIKTLTVSVRLDPGDPWVTTPIPIAWDERAEVDIGDVTVVLVP